jgi:hypothetical protein
MLGQTVFYTLTGQELAVLGSGRQNPAPAVVIGEPASGGLDLHVLLALRSHPVAVRLDVPAGAVGEPGTWNAASA